MKMPSYRGTNDRPPWSPEAFTDLEDGVRQSIRRIEVNPFAPHTGSVTSSLRT
ncbi:hypothetical protein MUK60_42200 [Streptomyces sp. LRE541]|uniref:hypothetical protein n=1 Tax=Streptomyces sp. LRE541 TaxID=2931983 RepID=UPI00200F08C1|nr:hypothetical protein [Streptomyces sp. LRE541]UPZ33838.1 hypothetical protein MUK60_42200 [Streptomyces sp. LRE541]